MSKDVKAVSAPSEYPTKTLCCFSPEHSEVASYHCDMKSVFHCSDEITSFGSCFLSWPVSRPMSVLKLLSLRSAAMSLILSGFVFRPCMTSAHKFSRIGISCASAALFNSVIAKLPCAMAIQSFLLCRILNSFLGIYHFTTACRARRDDFFISDSRILSVFPIFHIGKAVFVQ